MKRQSGFTLIELIIVIVILGILAVTVAPQFFNFGSDARASTVRALEGSMRAASEMVYARGQIGLEDGQVRVRGDDFVKMDGEYAEASEEGIGAALQVGNDWDEVDTITVEGVVYVLGPAGYGQGEPALPADLTSPGENDGTGCFAYYRWTDSATGEQTTPRIGSVTTGC